GKRAPIEVSVADKQVAGLLADSHVVLDLPGFVASPVLRTESGDAVELKLSAAEIGALRKDGSVELVVGGKAVRIETTERVLPGMEIPFDDAPGLWGGTPPPAGGGAVPGVLAPPGIPSGDLQNEPLLLELAKRTATLPA